MNESRSGRRGRFLYDGESLSITELLRKPGVSEYLQSNGPLTYGSQRNKLRRKLKIGNFNKEMVDEFLRQRQHQRQREVARRPQRGQVFRFNGENRTLTEILEQNPNIQQAYETRGVRTPLAQRNRLRRDLIEGRDPLTPIPPRRRGPSEVSPIIINGERLTARQNAIHNSEDIFNRNGGFLKEHYTRNFEGSLEMGEYRTTLLKRIFQSFFRWKIITTAPR